MKKQEKIKVGISVGDLNGVGIEVILKTFEDSRMLEFCTPIVFGSSKSVSFHKKALNIETGIHGVDRIDKVVHNKLNLLNVWKEMIDLELGTPTEISGKYAFESLRRATAALKKGDIDVLVTAPIDKHNIASKDFEFAGHTEYLASLTRSDRFAMMLVGGGGVSPAGLELPGLPALWDDGCIPALEKMVAAVKPYDTRFGVQLMHGGRQSYHDKKVAPSPIPAPAVVKGIPRELTTEDIKATIASFGDAARRCYQAGFDFIEVHGAHGYLVNQFLSLNANKREDEYGGSFANRNP